MNSGQQLIPLENRLFKNALYIGLSMVCVLILSDILFTSDYYSLLIETATLVFILINLVFVQQKNVSRNQRYIFSGVLGILVNLGWIAGGGISMLMTSIYFLSLCFIFIINDRKIYWIVFLFVLVNLVFLFSLEYFFHFNLSADYDPNKGGLIKQYVITSLLILFGAYFIIFLKVNYNKERTSLNDANKLLNVQKEEIKDRNEELVSSKETLDKTISALESQHKELMEIKDSLEDKVKERTEDLRNVNDRLLAQNQQLEQYTYITSHNLRAPIAQIRGLVHLIPLQGEFDDLTKETLGRLEESADNLDKIFSDLSTILRIEKNMQQAWEKVDLVKEIRNVVDSLKPSIEEKNISVVRPSNESYIINAMRPYVYSIIHNIVENAVKYSDVKKANSLITIEILDTSKFHRVSISDNGIGIDMDAASGKIFQMYQRFNTTHPGQGFGLFLVKSQMKAMDGKVEFESILGKGTRFDLYFPKRSVQE